MGIIRFDLNISAEEAENLRTSIRFLGLNVEDIANDCYRITPCSYSSELCSEEIEKLDYYLTNLKTLCSIAITSVADKEKLQKVYNAIVPPSAKNSTTFRDGVTKIKLTFDNMYLRVLTYERTDGSLLEEWKINTIIFILKK